jgi:hypothetical protein
MDGGERDIIRIRRISLLSIRIPQGTVHPSNQNPMHDYLQAEEGDGSDTLPRRG